MKRLRIWLARWARWCFGATEATAATTETAAKPAAAQKKAVEMTPDELRALLADTLGVPREQVRMLVAAATCNCERCQRARQLVRTARLNAARHPSVN